MNAGDKQPSGVPSGRGENWLPPIGEAVWVLCEGYRTMATLDERGEWRKLSDGKKLKGVVRAVRPK